MAATPEKASIVTHPTSSSAPTSLLSRMSPASAKPWVNLPTEQLPWSSARVSKVRSWACIQNTQGAATRPERPSSVGSDIGASNRGVPSPGMVSKNVIAIGACSRPSRAVSWVAASFLKSFLSGLRGPS